MIFTPAYSAELKANFPSATFLQLFFPENSGADFFLASQCLL